MVRELSLEEEKQIVEETSSGLAPSAFEKDMKYPSVQFSYVIFERINKLQLSREDVLEKLEENETPMTRDELARVEGGDINLFPQKFYDVLKVLGAKDIHFTYNVEFEDEEKVVEA